MAGWDAVPPQWRPQRPRNDEIEARRWRGPLNLDYRQFGRPQSVTFPICSWCRHIIWDWPHYEEEVPKDALCEACWKEEVEAQQREDDQWEDWED